MWRTPERLQALVTAGRALPSISSYRSQQRGTHFSKGALCVCASQLLDYLSISAVQRNMRFCSPVIKRLVVLQCPLMASMHFSCSWVDADGPLCRGIWGALVERKPCVLLEDLQPLACWVLERCCRFLEQKSLCSFVVFQEWSYNCIWSFVVVVFLLFFTYSC